MKLVSKEKQLISKSRVAAHGEVLTASREVEAMIDFVKNETLRVDSRFLEPACGSGNFLAAILNNKLELIASRYGGSQLDYERNALLAASSIYGIDILLDNVLQCRSRLYDVVDGSYAHLFLHDVKQRFRDVVRFILRRNIICGDALSLKTPGADPIPIVFSEWSPVNGSMIKRRDFTFVGLLDHASTSALPLFSDLGEDVFIPSPVKEYPLMHFLEIANVDEQ